MVGLTKRNEIQMAVYKKMSLQNDIPIASFLLQVVFLASYIVDLLLTLQELHGFSYLGPNLQ